jgi:benzoyl-CoA reductase subunit B
VPPGNRLSQSGTKLTQLALQSAGIPTLTLEADMVDTQGWSRERMTDHLSQFLVASGLG